MMTLFALNICIFPEENFSKGNYLDQREGMVWWLLMPVIKMFFRKIL